MAARLDLTLSTREQIMNVAEKRLVRFGYNGFSYADIASEIGLTNASVHYHFPTKADLGAALIDRYRQQLERSLSRIVEAEDDAAAHINALVALFDEAARKGELLMCTMLAAEFSTLPKRMQDNLAVVLRLARDWVIAVIERGAANGRFAIAHRPDELADALTSALHGALLTARVGADPTLFRTSAALLLAGLTQPVAR